MDRPLGTTFEGGSTTNCNSGDGNGCGTVFGLDPKTGTEAVFHSFGAPDGKYPAASLIDVNGTLYGTTYGGGTNTNCDCGTVFSITPDGSETVLYSFQGDGDASDPRASLIDVNGTLYGTAEGGAYGSGTVFSVNPTTGAETVLYSLGKKIMDGDNPVASLIEVKGKLYSTTKEGGTYGYGTVFSFDPATSKEKVLYSFGSGTDGAFPVASLIDVKGTLYGTTEAGGSTTNCSGNCGTVFALDPKTGAETVIYSFCSQQNCADGAFPVASLIDVKGTLYGTTEAGGSTTNCSGGCGTVFALNPSTGAETVLYSFGSGTDGAFPAASLIDVKGTLYGTTELGGGDNTNCNVPYGCGTVFALKKP